MDNTKIEMLLSQILESQNSMRSDISGMKSEITDMKSTMTEGFNSVNERIDTLSKGLSNMVTNEIADELSDQLKEIKDDIQFLTHKTAETEKDVYKIQNHLKIVK